MLHADSADISSTDIFNRGGKPRFGTTGSGGSVLRQCGIFLVVAFLAFAAAAIEIPKASGKALGITRGKPFSAGYVFVNGHFIDAPYVVERWGVGIRINGIPVVEEVIPWNEFLMTQEGVQVTKSESSVPEAEEQPEEEEEEESEFEDDFDDGGSLDDLFDDDPKPKKEKKPEKRKPKKRARQKPVVSVSYSLNGDFVPNDATKELVAKINKTRTDINATLIKGGFICFGDKYPRVSGDPRTAGELIANLPELMKRSETFDEFIARAKSARLLYLSETICADIYEHRRDYLRLMQRREKEKKDREWNKLLNGSGN